MDAGMVAWSYFFLLRRVLPPFFQEGITSYKENQYLFPFTDWQRLNQRRMMFFSKLPESRCGIDVASWISFPSLLFFPPSLSCLWISPFDRWRIFLVYDSFGFSFFFIFFFRICKYIPLINEFIFSYSFLFSI